MAEIHHESNRARSWPWWLPVIVIFGSLLIALGAVIAIFKPEMLVGPDQPITQAVHVYAGYLFSRNLALALMLLIALALRARRALSTLMVLTALVQILDAGVDASEARWPVMLGVLVFGTVFLIGAATLSGHAFWKPAAWRDGQ